MLPILAYLPDLMTKWQCPVTSTYKLLHLPNKPNYQHLDNKELKSHRHLLNGVNQQSYDSLLRSNKNKISQLGHSPKSLENLILSIFHSFLFRLLYPHNKLLRSHPSQTRIPPFPVKIMFYENERFLTKSHPFFHVFPHVFWPFKIKLYEIVERRIWR